MRRGGHDTARSKAALAKPEPAGLYVPERYSQCDVGVMTLLARRRPWPSRSLQGYRCLSESDQNEFDTLADAYRVSALPKEIGRSKFAYQAADDMYNDCCIEQYRQVWHAFRQPEAELLDKHA